MAKARKRSKPTTSFTLEDRHIKFLADTAESHRSNRSWVLGRILDLFMRSPKNLTNITETIEDNERAAD